MISLVLVIFLGIQLLLINRSKFAKRVYFALISLHLVVVVGFRAFHVGWDTQNYIWFFAQIQNYSFKDIIFGKFELEKGYVIFEFIVSNISSNPTMLFAVLAIIYIGAVGLLVYKNSSSTIMSYILFITMGFYTFSMTALRQTLALSFTILSFEYIKKRKLLPFVSLVLLAATIHRSALIFLPAYFVANLKFSKKYIVFAFLTMISLYIFKTNVFIFLAGASGYNFSIIETSGPKTLISMLVIVLIAGIIKRKDIINRNENNLIYFNMIFIGILLSIFAFLSPASLRAAYYYNIFTILFIPEVMIAYSKNNNIKTIMYLASMAFMIYLYINTLTPDSPFVPYRFIFQ